MTADIYTIFRRLIGDTTGDYTVADTELLKYLDMGIDRLSEAVDQRVVEDVTISATDISNGYVELSNYYTDIVDSGLGRESRDIYWQTDGGGKRINFIDSSGITAGTYEFIYRKRYKLFDGVVRDNDYFDYPRRADLGIVFYALAMYMRAKGVATVGDVWGAISSKSEEGISVSYNGDMTMKLSSPEELRTEATRIFRGLANRRSEMFSISV